MQIRFQKIQKIAEKISNAKIILYLADLGKDPIANVQGKDGVYYILLNYRINKTEEDIIRSVSHEIVHIKFQTNDHNENFQKEWNRIYNLFCRMMK